MFLFFFFSVCAYVRVCAGVSGWLGEEERWPTCCELQTDLEMRAIKGWSLAHIN